MVTMEDRDGFIWMDGEWLDWRKAKTEVNIANKKTKVKELNSIL